MFVGRDTELKELNREYHKEGFRFVVLYGRRRVGKTSLITQFIADKKDIFYISIEQNDKAALESFSEKVLEVFPSAKTIIDTFPSWEKAFIYIAEQSQKERIVLAIDEYPYLVNSNPSLSSLLQKLIDTVFQQSQLFLLLCGSSMSFMENQILGYQSPLYGRRTAQIKLEAFDFFDSALFYPHFSPEDQMIAYASFGGTPQYLNYLSKSLNISNVINENFLSKSGPLYEEPENLLKQELRELATYNSIIQAIAKGSTRLNEIATKTGEDSKKCAKYLKSLIELQIIQKEYPIGKDHERNGIYQLKDNMFKFWYRFVPKYRMNIEANMGQIILQERILPELNHYIGPIFEEVCKQYMIRQNQAHALAFPFFNIGRWWGTHPATKDQNEIDIIAEGEDQAYIGECKWTKDPLGTEVLESLKSKANVFKRYAQVHFLLFSKSGFTKPLHRLATNDPHLSLISYDSMLSAE